MGGDVELGVGLGGAAYDRDHGAAVPSRTHARRNPEQQLPAEGVAGVGGARGCAATALTHRTLIQSLLRSPSGRNCGPGIVHTRPHTARHVRLCGAFGRRLGLSLVLLLFAALSPCLGGLLGW